MRISGTERRDEDASPEAMEELGSFGGLDAGGESGTPKKFVRIQLWLPRKDAISLDEIRLRRMKKGQDVSRSALVTEAIRHIVALENDPKNKVEG